MDGDRWRTEQGRKKQTHIDLEKVPKIFKIATIALLIENKISKHLTNVSLGKLMLLLLLRKNASRHRKKNILGRSFPRAKESSKDLTNIHDSSELYFQAHPLERKLRMIHNVKQQKYPLFNRPSTYTTADQLIDPTNEERHFLDTQITTLDAPTVAITNHHAPLTAAAFSRPMPRGSFKHTTMLEGRQATRTHRHWGRGEVGFPETSRICSGRKHSRWGGIRQ